MQSLTKVDHDAVLGAYFRGGRPNIFAKGEVIVQGDNPYSYIHYIASGFVKGYTISDDGSTSLLIVKSAGDIIPLSTLLCEEYDPVYYEAINDVVTLSVAREDFENDLSEQPDLAMSTLKKSLNVLRDNTDRLRNLTIMDSRKRIISRLLFLLDRFGADSIQGRSVIFMPVTYPDLADSLNIARETANRIVRQLEEEGLVSKSRGRIIITDRNKLDLEVSGI